MVSSSNVYLDTNSSDPTLYLNLSLLFQSELVFSSVLWIKTDTPILPLKRLRSVLYFLKLSPNFFIADFLNIFCILSIAISDFFSPVLSFKKSNLSFGVFKTRFPLSF